MPKTYLGRALERVWQAHVPVYALTDNPSVPAGRKWEPPPMQKEETQKVSVGGKVAGRAVSRVFTKAKPSGTRGRNL